MYHGHPLKKKRIAKYLCCVQTPWRTIPFRKTKQKKNCKRTIRVSTEIANCDYSLHYRLSQ